MLLLEWYSAKSGVADQEWVPDCAMSAFSPSVSTTADGALFQAVAAGLDEFLHRHLPDEALNGYLTLAGLAVLTCA